MSAVSDAGVWKKDARREKNGEESRATDSAAEAPAKEIPPATQVTKARRLYKSWRLFWPLGTIWDNRS